VRRRLIVAAVLAVVALDAVVAAFVLWGPSAHASGEATIRTASLHPGEIDLVVMNDSSETTRLAQLIVNDAYVDFHATKISVAPGKSTRVAISYPWIAGESYDVEILTSTGMSIDYEIEDAEAA
jgi:hypothetical protein